MHKAMLAIVLLLTGFAARPAAGQSLPAPWVDLGFALAGTNGFPVLVPAGSLVAYSAVEITLTNAMPDQHAYLVIGLGTIYAPYKGGILVPSFDLLFQYPTGNDGVIHLLAHWPPGVPPGTPFVMQFWINDLGAPAGRAGSNAVGALTP